MINFNLNNEDKKNIAITVVVIIYLAKALSLPSILLKNGLEKKDAGYIIAVIEAVIAGLVFIVALNLAAGGL